MKKLWMRIGAEVELTDEAYEEFKKAIENQDEHRFRCMLRSFCEEAKISGETFIPSIDNLYDDDRYDNFEAEQYCDF